MRTAFQETLAGYGPAFAHMLVSEVLPHFEFCSDDIAILEAGGKWAPQGQVGYSDRLLELSESDGLSMQTSSLLLPQPSMTTAAKVPKVPGGHLLPGNLRGGPQGMRGH